MRYYYSTQPFLAWCLNNYFYNKKHFAYVAPFYPYRLPNPKSSCPYLIYQDIYMAWKDTDDFDKYMNQMRINIRKGVEKRDKEGGIFNASANDLKDICERLEILFLYPIVYRVDIEGTSVKRKLQATNWSRKGSDEWGVDLDGGEFGLLFLDHAGDSDFDAFKADALKLDASMPDGLTPYQALAILKWRSKP